MRKGMILSVVLLCIVSLASFAQKPNFKPFKVDVSLGYAIPGGDGGKAGVLFAGEPKYAIRPNISVGLRMEAALMARFSGYNDEGEKLDADIKAAGSYVATADYYINDNYSFHPFIGAGAGIYTMAGLTVDDGTGTIDEGGSKFGGLIRAGFEAGHFRMGFEYNLVPKRTIKGYDINGDLADVDSKNSYIGIKIGVCFGGGPR